MGFIAAAIAVAGAASAGASIYQAQSAAKESKRATEAAVEQNQAAVQQVKEAQATASTKAVETVKRRTQAMTQTVYTSPLGLNQEAMVAKKTLLGQ